VSARAGERESRAGNTTGSHHPRIFIRRILQPRSSATAGHECLCACASCLCLSVMPCQPYPCRYYFPSRSSPTRPLLLVFIQVYRAELPLACQCQRLVLFALVTGEVFTKFQQLQRQLSTVSAATSPSPAHIFLCTCRFVTMYCSLHLISAFCVALSSPSVFGLRSSVTSVSSISRPTPQVVGQNYHAVP